MPRLWCRNANAEPGHPYLVTQITILSCMRDEGTALLEWVAYQRLIGAERIVVYTNDCRDGTDAMLDRMAEMGLGVLRRINPVQPGGKPQPKALSAAQSDPAVIETDWLLPIDSDEFVAVKCGAGRLPDLIQAVPQDTDGIVITWRIMGSSGLTDWNPGLVLEHYTRGAEDSFRRGWGVKTLFRPFAHLKLGIHRPTIKRKDSLPERRAALLAQNWVNGSGGPMSHPFMEGMWTSTAPTLGYDLVECAHYAVKSRENYVLRSVRGNVNAKPDKYDDTYFAVFDRNEIEVPLMARHLPALRDMVADLRRDPFLGPLEAEAIEWHAARLRELRATPEHSARMARLAQAHLLKKSDLDRVLYLRPFGPQGLALTQKFRAQGLPESEVAQHLNAAIAHAEKSRDARCANDLAARGLLPSGG